MSLMVKMLNVTRMNLIYKISLTFLFAIASNLFSISEESYTFQYKESEFKVNIINKKSRIKLTRGRKVKVSGFKKAIITLKKGQSIDLTTGI